MCCSLSLDFTYFRMDHTHYQPIVTDAEYDAVFARSRREAVLIYKHSTQCELCAAAKEELLRLTESDDPPVFAVVVQTARPLSNMIERALGIRHESPQVILLKDEVPVFSTSHLGVTASAVRKAVENLA